MLQNINLVVILFVYNYQIKYYIYNMLIRLLLLVINVYIVK